jgi:catechol 2,3-dioxygenase-like lactoylglutathione lyase family enzyme
LPVHYPVNDVNAAVAWYTTHLGFKLLSNQAPAFAELTHGSLRFLLSGATSPYLPMHDRERLKPGGWVRIPLIVDNLHAEVERLRGSGAQFQGDIVTGPGGSHILLIDPSGNRIDLFQPVRR